MPDPAKLPYENPLAAIGGGYYGQLGGNPAANMPMRPPGQDVAALPPAPKASYVDQIDNGQARLLDDKGNAHMEPAKDYWKESMMTDGSQPHDDPEGLRLRSQLSRGDTGGPIDLSMPPPKVPLAPGSPGPPIPPAADSMIGVKKRSGDTKRRRIP